MFFFYSSEKATWL